MKIVPDKSKFCEARMCLACSKLNMKPMWLVWSEHRGEKGEEGEWMKIGYEGEQEA